MCAHSNLWDTAPVTTPANSLLIADIPSTFRTLRLDIEERMLMGHLFPGDDTDGRHKEGSGRMYVGTEAERVAGTGLIEGDGTTPLDRKSVV